MNLRRSGKPLKRPQKSSPADGVSSESNESEAFPSRVPYFAIVKLKDQLGPVTNNALFYKLRSYPTLSGIWLPCSGADVVNRCHGEGRTSVATDM